MTVSPIFFRSDVKVNGFDRGIWPTQGGCLAPKATDEVHHTDGWNWSGDTPTPTLLFYPGYVHCCSKTLRSRGIHTHLTSTPMSMINAIDFAIFPEENGWHYHWNCETKLNLCSFSKEKSHYANCFATWLSQVTKTNLQKHCFCLRRKLCVNENIPVKTIFTLLYVLYRSNLYKKWHGGSGGCGGDWAEEGGLGGATTPY